MAYMIDGSRIRELRFKKEMSQVDLANTADVNISLLSKIENDRHPCPHISTIEAIAEALETTEADIMRKIEGISIEEWRETILNQKKEERERWKVRNGRV